MSGFERLRELPKRSRQVMELAKNASKAFTNGDLGIRKQTDNRWPDLEVFLVLNDSTRELARSAGKAFAPLKEHTHEYPFWAIAHPFASDPWKKDLREVGDQFEHLFWFYFWVSRWDHLVNRTAIKPMNIGVARDCEKAIGRETRSGADYALKKLTWMMGKQCAGDKQPGEDVYSSTGRDLQLMDAKLRGLEGENTNKCFHKYFIRSTKYDEKMYETFAEAMALNLFLE
ncbi:hypothetical protein AAVH_17834, partial [Aphelenchoides avenae]